MSNSPRWLLYCHIIPILHGATVYGLEVGGPTLVNLSASAPERHGELLF